MHTWVKVQQFHGSLGFYTATNAIDEGQCLLLANSFPSHIPGQNTTLVKAFPRYILQFAACWYDACLSPYNPIWKSQPPLNQIVHNPAPLMAVKLELLDMGTK